MGKRPSEEEFVNEGLSDEEVTALSTDPGIDDAVQDDATDDAAADQAESAASEQEPGDKQSKTAEEARSVDLRALQEARAESRELREKYARLEERTNMMLERLNKPEQQEEAKDEDPEPDPNKDIFAHNAWLKRQFEREKQANSEWRQTQQQASEQQRQAMQVEAEWRTSVQQFTQQQPDFGEAAQYLSDLRSQQLAALGLDQNSINATINQELVGVIQQAKSVGKSPAELVYAYASVSGYKPKAAEQQAQQGGADNIRRIAEQQDRHRSLSDAAGGEAPAPMNAKTLAQMSDKEFFAMMKNPAKAAEVDRIMGIA